MSMHSPPRNWDSPDSISLSHTDLDEEIRQRRSELKEIQRKNADLYDGIASRAVTKASTPKMQIASRTPTSEAKMHSVLSKWMNGADDAENTPPPLSPSRRSTAATSSSPWKRHIAMLTDAKETAVRAREGEEAALQRLEVYQGEIDGLKGSVSGLDAKLDAVVDAMKTGGLAAPVDRGGEQEAAELRLGMVELKKEQEASSEQLKATVAEQRAQMEDFKTILRTTARGQSAASPATSPLRTVLVWGTVLALLIWSYVLKGNCNCTMRRTVRYTH